MVKKFMCVKHAEDCYALQEAVRFVTFFDKYSYLVTVGACVLNSCF